MITQISKLLNQKKDTKLSGKKSSTDATNQSFAINYKIKIISKILSDMEKYNIDEQTACERNCISPAFFREHRNIVAQNSL